MSATALLLIFAVACGDNDSSEDTTAAGASADTEATDPSGDAPAISASPTSTAADEPTAELGATDSSPVEPSPATRTIVWQPNQAEVLGNPIDVGAIDVPVDYDNPDGPQLRLVLTRMKTQSKERTGVLMYNPGGPGEAVIKDAPVLLAAFGTWFPTMDIVLADNRGTGFSKPLECLTAEQWTSLGSEAAAEADAGEAEGDATGQLAKRLSKSGEFIHLLADACVTRQADLLYLGSENVARDMDALRAALGEEQLNFWGVSYGTMQGALYAQMFPERVRAFVLDSPVWRTAEGPNWVQNINQMAKAYEEQLNRFLAEAGTDPESPLFEHEAGSSSEIFDALTLELRAGVEWEGKRLSTTLLGGVSVDLLSAAEWPTLAQLLADAARGDWTLLVSFTDQVGSEEATPELLHAREHNIMLNMLEYGCPAGFDLEQATTTAQDMIAQYPRLGWGVSEHLGRCLDWDLSLKGPRIVASDLQSPPLLVLSGLNDPATPHSDAVGLVAQLNNGSHLLTNSTEGHGTAISTSCGLAALSNFMATGDAAGAPDECAPDEVAEEMAELSLQVLRPRLRVTGNALRTYRVSR